MVYPRQKLYDLKHSGFLTALATGRLNDGNTNDFVEAFAEFIDTPAEHLVALARGRLTLYFAARKHVSGAKNKVLMSPFTIFDLINMAICGGGHPQFIDTEQGSPHLSLASIKAAVTSETALVVVTHYHTVNPEIAEIAAFLKERGIPLLEDCAISLGGRVNQQHVGTFGDYGLFSFGLFKFIATYFGGSAWIRDLDTKNEIESEIEQWPKMTAFDLRPYVTKGLKYTTATNPIVFNAVTFPIFRHGYLNGVDWIKKNAVNDPNPELKTELPDSYKRRPSDYQQRDWKRQLAKVLDFRESRLARAEAYAESFEGSNSVRNWSAPDLETDCFLNFPINVDDPEAVLKQIMKQGFDASPYFYRNCAKLDCFKEYAVELKNVDQYASEMIILPAYPDIPIDYVKKLASAVKTAATEHSREG